jgi:hypothetical protein
MNGKDGGHHDALVREVRRIKRGRWLQPDVLLDDLGEDARGWLSDRLDEVLAALTPWSEGDSLPTALGLRVTRSMHEAEQAWREACGPDGPTASGATLRAFGRASEAAKAGAAGSEKNRRSVERFAAVVGRKVQGRFDELAVVLASGEVVASRSTDRLSILVARHLEWTIAFGDAPSPFGPLIAVWMRGAWPAVLPGDEVLVYVPVEQDGRVVPWLEGDPVEAEAEHPALVRHGPRRRPIAAETSDAPPVWWQLGISFPPAFEVRATPSFRGRIAAVGPAPRGDRRR